MKRIHISMTLVAGVLCCATVMAGSADTNGIVTIESSQSQLQPRTGVTYRIAPNWLYKADDPGPAEGRTSTAWELANEFVFRTALRESLELPAHSAGKREEDDCYVVAFVPKGNGKGMTLIVDLEKRTVSLGKIE